MIKINLLPPELRGRKARDRMPAGPVVGNILLGAVVLAVVLVCGATGYNLFSAINTVSAQADRLGQEAAIKQKEYDRKTKENQEMKAKWDRMKVQEEILNVLVPNNPLLWSEKINMLANLIPAGVYVTQLHVEENSDLVETEYSKRLRQEYDQKKARIEKQSTGKEGVKEYQQQAEVIVEPPKTMKPVITQILSIQGVATGKDQNERRNKVQAFQERLKKYSMTNKAGKTRKFMDNFTPDVAYGTQEAKVQDGVEVWGFEFKLTTRPFGFSSKERQE